MKRLKKLSCLVLAMAPAFSLCIPSYAVDDVLAVEHLLKTTEEQIARILPTTVL